MRRPARALLVTAAAVSGVALVTGCGSAALHVSPRAESLATSSSATASSAPAPASATPSTDTTPSTPTGSAAAAPSASVTAAASGSASAASSSAVSTLAAPTGAIPLPSLPATPPTPSVPAGRWAVGDSVMLGSKPLLDAAGFHVDAVVGRQFGAAKGLVAQLRASGHLPRNLIVHLGTNGTIAMSDCRAVVNAAGPQRRVFLVTVHGQRSWMPGDNVHLLACARAFPAGRVVLVDWNHLSSPHPEWFYRDGIHPQGAGRRAYTHLLAATVARYGL